MKRTQALSTAFLIALLAAWVVSLIGHYDVVLDVDPNRTNAGPSSQLWLGADDSGRDVFQRLMKSTEAFVGPGLLACFVAALLAVPLGAWAGWTGGWLGESIRFLFTSVAALPRFVLVLLVCSIYGTGGVTLGVAAGLAYAPALSEAIYDRVSRFRRAGFVMAAQAHGLTTKRILGWHIRWVNARALIGGHLLQLFGYFLLVETTLSFLGDFGVQEPMPSWGNMISRDALQGGVNDLNLWATAAPVVAIWLTVWACAKLAQSLDEVDDV
ncbi:MAG: ABC transporter permease [Myxococcota bacterium]|nr:ABC transporter permease [Myxococcota bacterium]